jgi:oxygen-dependent protoporphyrinogen oxidase
MMRVGGFASGGGRALASIIVVGGGLAGLTCAWRLRRAGHRVEVFERAGEPGGRLRSDVRGGFQLTGAPATFARGARNLETVAQALGLTDRIRTLPSASTQVLRDGALYAAVTGPRALLNSRLLSPRSRLRLARLPLLIASHRSCLEPGHPERAAELDERIPVDGLRLAFGDECVDYGLGPLLAARLHSDASDLSPAFALVALRSLSVDGPPACFDGGPGVLTERLAERVSVRRGCEATAVETETDGVRVRYRLRGREGRAFADAAVVAVPGFEVVRLCPKLTPEERGYFQSVRYARGAIVHLLFDRAPLLRPGLEVVFPGPEGLDVATLGVAHATHHAAPDGAGLLRATLTPAAAERLWGAPARTLAETALASIARTPIGAMQPREVVVQRWPALRPRFESGSLVRLDRFQRRLGRSPRLAFAGDHLVGPRMEDAVTSGMRAATEILRTL